MRGCGRIADDPPKTGPVAFPTEAQLVFAESHAAAIKHTVTRVEKTMGVVKAYLQLKAVTATKQMASAHAMLRTRAKVSAGQQGLYLFPSLWQPSCFALHEHRYVIAITEGGGIPVV